MSKIATIDIVVNIQGDGTNDTFRLSNGPWPTSFSDSVGVRQSLLIGNGGNSIVLPIAVDGTKPSMVLILPPATSANAKNLSGNTLTFTTGPVLWQIPATTPSFNINNAGSNEQVEFIWF